MQSANKLTIATSVRLDDVELHDCQLSPRCQVDTVRWLSLSSRHWAAFGDCRHRAVSALHLLTIVEYSAIYRVTHFGTSPRFLSELQGKGVRFCQWTQFGPTEKSI